MILLLQCEEITRARAIFARARVLFHSSLHIANGPWPVGPYKCIGRIPTLIEMLTLNYLYSFIESITSNSWLGRDGANSICPVSASTGPWPEWLYNVVSCILLSFSLSFDALARMCCETLMLYNRMSNGVNPEGDVCFADGRHVYTLSPSAD